MINVYHEGKVISRVRYNNNLDALREGRWSCGELGRHKGIAKLSNGLYVLIKGTEWQGEITTAGVISKSEALQEIINSGNLNLLTEPRFAELGFV